VLAAVAVLEGVAAEELQAHELAHDDPQYELLVTVRAVRAAGDVDADDAGAGA
jgi:hypothetical protein